MIEEIWDGICDGFFYLISFEWLSVIWEFITSMFENISEFSIIGTTLGVIGIGFIFIFRKMMLNPFLIHMKPIESTFWMVATYLGAFIGGYLVGKHFENT